jgi:arsenate reductase
MKLIQTTLFPKIEEILKSLKTANISDKRKEILQPLINYVQDKVSANQQIRLNFICTHNSRRSHLSQIWAQASASYFGISNIFCYSGGTEATALFTTVVKTLQDSGFQIVTISEEKNPIYFIKFAENAHPIIGYSKTYDDSFNPKNEFAAIMTCTQADEGCPFISGAEKRIAIPFEDPKVFDNTPQQVEKYQERSLQIATEMMYVFSNINKYVD